MGEDETSHHTAVNSAVCHGPAGVPARRVSHHLGDHVIIPAQVEAIYRDRSAQPAAVNEPTTQQQVQGHRWARPPILMPICQEFSRESAHVLIPSALSSGRRLLSSGRSSSGRFVGGAPIIRRECSRCGTTVTPQWRRAPADDSPMCNACYVRRASGDSHRPFRHDLCRRLTLYELCLDRSFVFAEFAGSSRRKSDSRLWSGPERKRGQRLVAIRLTWTATQLSVPMRPSRSGSPGSIQRPMGRSRCGRYRTFLPILLLPFSAAMPTSEAPL